MCRQMIIAHRSMRPATCLKKQIQVAGRSGQIWVESYSVYRHETRRRPIPPSKTSIETRLPLHEAVLPSMNLLALCLQ